MPNISLGPPAPQLLVSIDTEPDDQWALRPTITNQNIKEIPRLQSMFDRYRVRPTYLVSYEVAHDPQAAEILKDIWSRGKCEIGCHLHAWTTPPYVKIHGEIWQSHPHLYRYSEDVQRRKFETVHSELTRVFGFEPTSHRAGRYGLDPHGVRLLKEFDYKVDTSVTPLMNWSDDDQTDQPGPDFRRAPLGIYELSEEDVCTPGQSGVIEVPVSVGYTKTLPKFAFEWLRVRHDRSLLARAMATALGIRRRSLVPRPDTSLEQVRSTARCLLGSGTQFLHMAFHSSELIVNSGFCTTEEATRLFFRRIEEIVVMAQGLGCQTGMTLSEFVGEKPQ